MLVERVNENWLDVNNFESTWGISFFEEFAAALATLEPYFERHAAIPAGRQSVESQGKIKRQSAIAQRQYF